jgi:DNA-binding response OmpR family regulator
LASARTERPDLIVLDLGLPGLDGLDVTRTLRKSSDVPIIMLTARAEEADRIVGLELGADDYLVKPFSPKELVARVRAVLRRVDASVEAPDLVRAGDLEIDTTRRTVCLNGRAIDLTATEFELLLHFARSPGRVFTRSQLLDALHGVAFESLCRRIGTPPAGRNGGRKVRTGRPEADAVMRRGRDSAAGYSRSSWSSSPFW